MTNVFSISFSWSVNNIGQIQKNNTGSSKWFFPAVKNMQITILNSSTWHTRWVVFLVTGLYIRGLYSTVLCIIYFTHKYIVYLIKSKLSVSGWNSQNTSLAFHELARSRCANHRYCSFELQEESPFIWQYCYGSDGCTLQVNAIYFGKIQ